MRYALVREGVVDDVILWDGETEYDPGAYEVVALDDDSPVGPGWAYDGATFTAPLPPPEE